MASLASFHANRARLVIESGCLLTNIYGVHLLEAVLIPKASVYCFLH